MTKFSGTAISQNLLLRSENNNFHQISPTNSSKTMNNFLILISHWLPLIQGFAALASIAGALLSWKYALKAQRAREEMTENVIAARLVERFEKTLNLLKEFRSVSVLENGKPDDTAYRVKEQEHKHLMEETLAVATATAPYFRKKPEAWSSAIGALAEATGNPNALKIEYACKYIALVSEQLKVAASTREFSPTI